MYTMEFLSRTACYFYVIVFGYTESSVTEVLCVVAMILCGVVWCCVE